MDRRFAILTNTPTPYRTAFFNVLHEELHAEGIRFEVLYCAAIEPHRKWNIDFSAQKFEWRIFAGVSPRIRDVSFHINPAVLWHLYRRKPQWLLVAGSWNTPTMAASVLLGRRSVQHLLFWSEGHPDAVRFRTGPVVNARRLMLRRFRGFAVPNKRSAVHVQTDAPGKPVINLANTVDEQFYSSKPREEDILELRRLLAEDRPLKLVAVCQLERRKGIDRILQAVRGLPKGLQERLSLVVIGDGSLRASLEQAAREALPARVTVLGHRSAEFIRAALHVSDAFILGSLLDPNPLSPIEAAFAGCPLLLSSLVGNVEELIVEGETGYAFDPRSLTDIQRAIATFADLRAEDRPNMRSAVNAKARSSFTRRAVAQQFVKAVLTEFPPQ